MIKKKKKTDLILYTKQIFSATTGNKNMLNRNQTYRSSFRLLNFVQIDGKFSAHFYPSRSLRQLRYQIALACMHGILLQYSLLYIFTPALIFLSLRIWPRTAARQKSLLTISSLRIHQVIHCCYTLHWAHYRHKSLLKCKLRYPPPSLVSEVCIYPSQMYCVVLA